MDLTSENIAYEKIPFEKVKVEIEQIFLNSTIDQWDLTPNDISGLADSTGIKVSWEEIEWWNAFEYGNREVGVKEFFSLLFTSSIPMNSEVIVVTDECFADKLAYQLRYKDLEQFCDTVYPTIYQMEFFQPHDFLFIFPQNKLLIILHHEGLFAHFKTSDKYK